MAERTILVCDECGKPAAETVTIKVARGNFVKDLCTVHVNALVTGARKPRPGRRKGVVAGSGSGATERAKSGAPRAKRASTGKRRGRPPKKASA